MLSIDLNATQVGTVGEQFVRYKLMRWGYPAVMMEHSNSYDILVMDEDTPIKIQVKSTLGLDKSRPTTYRFHTRKGSQNTISYSKTDIDLFAFVALDIQRVRFGKYQKAFTKRIHKDRFKEDEYERWIELLESIKVK